jgi:hypothetical protein
VAIEKIIWRTPERFTCGDTLLFQLNLPNHLPSDGWSVRLTVAKNGGEANVPVAQIVSAPDSSNKYHVFNQPGFLAQSSGGIYTLVEEVINVAGNAGINVAAGEKHQIYYVPDFQLLDSVDSANPVKSNWTQAQKFLNLLNKRLEGLYELKFSETESDRNRFKVADEEAVLESMKYWKEVRQHEIQVEKIRNGQNPGNVVRPLFMIGC